MDKGVEGGVVEVGPVDVGLGVFFGFPGQLALVFENHFVEKFHGII